FYRVPRTLRDLLVEIRIAGYTPEEKVEIARERLLPRLIAEHGLEPGDVAIPDPELFHPPPAYPRTPGLGRRPGPPSPLPAAPTPARRRPKPRTPSPPPRPRLCPRRRTRHAVPRALRTAPRPRPRQGAR